MKKLLLPVIFVLLMTPLASQAFCCRISWSCGWWSYTIQSGQGSDEKYTEKTTDMDCKVALSHLKTKLTSLDSQLDAAIPGNKCACFANPGDVLKIEGTTNYAWSGTDCNPTNDGLPKVGDFDKASCQDTPNKQSNTISTGNPPQAGGTVNYGYSTVTNPLQTVSVPVVAGRIVNAFLLIVGSIFLIIIIYGGFVWMTAAGNEAKVAKGRKTLSWGVMGIIVIFLAWMLVAFIFETLNV